MVNVEAYNQIISELTPKSVTLVAVSKTKPVEDILELYNLGQRDFGENYVQELVDKQAQLPQDIRWHFIGHLQSNKVKYIASFVHLIHGIDNEKLLNEVNKQAAKQNRMIHCLLQIHIAIEETKFGMNKEEAELLVNKIMSDEQDINISLEGLMGLASNTDNINKTRNEFKQLKELCNKLFTISTNNNQPPILSMGMSGDYKIAVEEGSNMVRIGSLLFGERNYKQ